MIKKIHTTISVLIIIISAYTLDAQVSLEKISLKEKVENSSLIIEGEVIAKRSFWDSDHRIIYTANTVQVYKVFKGDVVETVEVLTEGGVVGLKALVVSHSLKLQKGNIGIFTLYESKVSENKEKDKLGQRYKAYSSSQGFYHYDIQNDAVFNTLGKSKGIKSSLYQSIFAITKANYVEVTPFDVENKKKERVFKNSLLAPAITSFSPTTITAGTGSVLTINGSGFGTVKGKVGFRNSDDGGSSFFDALDDQVLTWGENQITVEVPSLDGNRTAGTGIIRVTDDNGDSITSASVLTVSFAQINVPFGSETYQVQHYGDNNTSMDGFSGGYTWEMQTDFFNDTEHPGAKAAFMRALETWRCETKVNWEVSATATTTDVIGVADLSPPLDGELDADGENVIRFDNGNELGAGTLGTCYSWYSGLNCSPIVWWVSDLDIVFDSERNWYFGASGETFDAGEFDFETVALHELGHGHQLGHVIDPSNVMHFALAANSSSNILDLNSIAGANDVHSRSTTNQICNGTPLMTDYAGSCTLELDENELERGISIYPNPANDKIFIKNSSYVSLKSATLYDISGRNVIEFDISKGSKLKTINISEISSGVYFIRIASGATAITRKLVVE